MLFELSEQLQPLDFEGEFLNLKVNIMVGRPTGRRPGLTQCPVNVQYPTDDTGLGDGRPPAGPYQYHHGI